MLMTTSQMGSLRLRNIANRFLESFADFKIEKVEEVQEDNIKEAKPEPTPIVQEQEKKDLLTFMFPVKDPLVQEELIRRFGDKNLEEFYLEISKLIN